MNVITINGHIGCGAPEIGAEVARMLNLEYVDRLIIAQAANRLGATEDAVAERERRALSLVDRITRFLQGALERSAAAGTGGDPYFGPGLGTMLGREYLEVTRKPITRADELDDEKFIEVTMAVIQEIAQSGNAVILGRAGNMILKDLPDSFHVNLVATVEHRVPIVAALENISEEEAGDRVTRWDAARDDYFTKFFKVNADDPLNYDMVLSTERIGHDMASGIIVNSVRV